MAKVSFSKIEDTFTEALRKMLINRLCELATIVTLVNDSQSKIPPKVIEKLIQDFQKELKSLKEKDVKLYSKLNLTPEEEKTFFGTHKDFTKQDWDRLRTLKETIEDLKGKLYGQETPPQDADSIQVEKERIKHINKRYNIRDGWLPLH